MSVVKKTLEENYIFFIKELARLNKELKCLPLGSISKKNISGSTYYYQQWREGKQVKSFSLGKEAPPDLVNKINKRKNGESQRKEILSNLNTIIKAINPQRITVREIIRLFCKHKIKFMIIGSHCLPVFKEKLGMELPTIKTQDIDLLIKVPYDGREQDIESLVSSLNFTIGFSPDGATFFTNGIFKIEFLTPEKGRGTGKAVYIKKLKVGATPLRYLQMLFDGQILLKEEDFFYPVPNPWIFAYHKILITKTRKIKTKKEKDLLQAFAILREIMKKPSEYNKARLYLKSLPSPWSKYIKEQLKKHLPDFLGH